MEGKTRHSFANILRLRSADSIQCSLRSPGPGKSVESEAWSQTMVSQTCSIAGWQLINLMGPVITLVQIQNCTFSQFAKFVILYVMENDTGSYS